MFLDEQEFERVKQALNKIEFPGCENVLIGDVLHYSIKYINIEHSIKRIIRLLYRKFSIYRRLLINNYSYKKNTGDSLFLFSSSYGTRKEQRAVFLRLAGLFPLSSYACYDGKKRFSLRNLRYVGLFWKWKNLIKSVSDDAVVRVSILSHLCNVFLDYKDAERQFGENFASVQILISWCDCHPIDSFFTQKFNSMNKNTVELMHGSIGDKGNNKWSVLGVKSKNFIADSKNTKDMMERNNYAGKIYVCGYVYGIDSDFKKETAIKDIKSFGVILSGESKVFHEANLSLCRDVARLKGKNEADEGDGENDKDSEDRKNVSCLSNTTILCKLHPTSRTSQYPQDCWNIFSHVYGSEISSTDFLSKIDAAIICPSTVLYEALYHNLPFLAHSDEENIYRGYGIPDEIAVHDMNELEEKLKRMLNGDFAKIYEELTDYYAIRGNVKENYLSAFHELGIY